MIGWIGEPRVVSATIDLSASVIRSQMARRQRLGQCAMQQASERGGAGLVYFAFDLLELEGENLVALPLSERKSRLASLLTKPPNRIKFSDHEGGDGEAFRCAAWRRPRRPRLEAARPALSAR